MGFNVTEGSLVKTSGDSHIVYELIEPKDSLDGDVLWSAEAKLNISGRISYVPTTVWESTITGVIKY